MIKTTSQAVSGRVNTYCHPVRDVIPVKNIIEEVNVEPFLFEKERLSAGWSKALFLQE